MTWMSLYTAKFLEWVWIFGVCLPTAKNWSLEFYFAIGSRTIGRTNGQFCSKVVSLKVCQICGWKCEKSPLRLYWWNGTFDPAFRGRLVEVIQAWCNSTMGVVVGHRLAPTSTPVTPSMFKECTDLCLQPVSSWSTLLLLLVHVNYTVFRKNEHFLFSCTASRKTNQFEWNFWHYSWGNADSAYLKIICVY